MLKYTALDRLPSSLESYLVTIKSRVSTLNTASRREMALQYATLWNTDEIVSQFTKKSGNSDLSTLLRRYYYRKWPAEPNTTSWWGCRQTVRVMVCGSALTSLINDDDLDRNEKPVVTRPRKISTDEAALVKSTSFQPHSKLATCPLKFVSNG